MRAGLGFAAALLLAAAFAHPAQGAVTRLSIAPVRVAEGDSGTKRVLLLVRRAGPARRRSSARYATANRTATAGRDYVRKRGRVRFRPGQRRKRIAVLIRGDRVDEPNERFVVRLSKPRGARLARPRAVVTIVDDDPPPNGGGPPGGGPPGGGPPPAPQVVRFVAFGAQGEGNQGQLDVAAAVEAKCAADGCDFVQGLGNNFYDDGVDSVTDAQFDTKFETPYASIALPFWMTLGNHDHGGNGSVIEAGKAQHQVDYTSATGPGVSGKWEMPATYYRRSEEHVDFVTLDTTPTIFDEAGGQATDVPAWLEQSAATWKIVVGLHGYRSNGPHGNAGSYDGVTAIPFASGEHFKDFMDANVCGEADLYLSAHDHSLQWPSETCDGTELIVSGTGSKTTTLPGSQANHFQSATLGFVYVVIRDRRLTAEFVDVDGTSLFTRSISK